MKEFKLLINGKLVPGAARQDVINPATEEVLAEAPRADRGLLNEAIAGTDPAAGASASPVRKSRRNRRDSTRTGKRKPGRHGTQRFASSDIPPPRHDHVDMRMVGHCRTPAVEHGGGADASTEVPGIDGDGEQRLGRGAEQQVVDHRLFW